MKKAFKKCVASLIALSVCAAGIDYTSTLFADSGASAGSSGDPRIVVDINANDGRKASYSKNAQNWIVAGGSSASAEFNNVTYTLSNGGSVGGNIRSVYKIGTAY